MTTVKGLEILSYQDRLYYVYRKINANRIKEGQILNVRDAWHCDTVLKSRNQEEVLIFLIEMPDAIIVNEPIPSPEITEK